MPNPIRNFRRALGVLLASVGLGIPWLPAKDVVVASYNLENYLRMDRREGSEFTTNAPKPEEQIESVISVIQQINPDILGIVEIGGQDMLEDLRGRLRAAGLDYPHSEWVKGADAARHIALLSRFPIVERHSRDDVPFELDGKQQRVGRGILDVTVELAKSYRLRLVGAHLKSRRQVPEFDEKAMRAREASIFRRHLDSILAASPDDNLMLFGDLNDTKNELPVRELIGSPKSPAYMRDLFLTDRYGYRWTHFWSAADTYSRIDYMLVSRGLWPEINRDRSGISSHRTWYKASDHRAIYATITVPDP